MSFLSYHLPLKFQPWKSVDFSTFCINLPVAIRLIAYAFVGDMKISSVWPMLFFFHTTKQWIQNAMCSFSEIYMLNQRDVCKDGTLLKDAL